MSKKLTESKKAQNAWIGSAVIVAVGFAADYFQLPQDTLLMIVGGILSLFGISIGGQAIQDKAIASAPVAVEVDEDDFDIPAEN